MTVLLSTICAFAIEGVPFVPSAVASDNLTAPTPPFVASVPENAQWTIRVSGPDKAGASVRAVPANSAGEKQAQLQEIQVIKTGPLKHDTLVYDNGSKDEAWYIGNKALQSDTFVKTNIYLIDFAAHDFTGAGDPTRSLGFTGMDWLQLKYFDKIATYQGVSCYHYSLPNSSRAEAWINVKNNLPVAYQINRILYVYAFGAPPTAPLILPPAYQAILDKSLEIKKRQEEYARTLGQH